MTEKSMRKQHTTGRAFFCISAVMFAGLLMLVLNLIWSFFATDVLIDLFGREFFTVEWHVVLAEILLYLLMMLIPGCFLLIVFRKNPLSPFAGPLSTPRLPFLYLMMTIGLLYLLNLIVNLVLGDLLAPFDTPVDPASMPLSAPGILLYFLYLSILPAIFEEWLFRGIMLRNLLPTVGKWPAILISSLIFGLMHLDPAQSIFAFGFGIFAGYAYVCTGSIWFGSLLHMLNNAISGGITYWYFVFEIDEISWLSGIYTLLMILLGILSALIYIFRVLRKRKLMRKTPEERRLPTGRTTFRLTVGNPILYLVIAGYAFLLWLYYFAAPV